MSNKWYVYGEYWSGPLAVFDSYDEAEAFVQTRKEADRQEGWYSSEYEICKGSDIQCTLFMIFQTS